MLCFFKTGSGDAAQTSLEFKFLPESPELGGVGAKHAFSKSFGPQLSGVKITGRLSNTLRGTALGPNSTHREHQAPFPLQAQVVKPKRGGRALTLPLLAQFPVVLAQLQDELRAEQLHVRMWGQDL